MEDRSHAIVAVSFLILFVILLFLVYMWMQGGESVSRYYDVVSDYAVGVQAGSEVKYKGLKVGAVKSVHFDPDNPEKVIVRIGVYKSAYVTRATYAQVSQQGLTGQQYVALANSKNQPHTPLPTSEQNPARIPMRPGFFQQISESARSDLERVNQVLDNLAQMVSDENRRRVNGMLANLDRVSSQLAALEQSLAPAVQALPQLTDQSGKLLQQGRALVGQARQPVEEVGSAAQEVKAFGTSAQALVRQMSTTVPRLQELTAQLNKTAKDLDQLGEQLKRAPESVIFGKNPATPGPGEPGFRPPG